MDPPTTPNPIINYKGPYSPQYYKKLAAGKKYREANKDKIAERNKLYYEKNKERIAERNKLYHEKNKDKIAERNKLYHEKNKDKIAEYQKQYYQDHKEEIDEYNRQYYQSHKDEYNAQKHPFPKLQSVEPKNIGTINFWKIENNFFKISIFKK